MSRYLALFLLVAMMSSAYSHPLIDKAIGNCGKDWIPASCLIKVVTIVKATEKVASMVRHAKHLQDMATLARKRKAAQRALAVRRVKRIKSLMGKAWRYNPSNLVRRKSVSTISTLLKQRSK